MTGGARSAAGSAKTGVTPGNTCDQCPRPRRRRVLPMLLLLWGPWAVWLVAGLNGSGAVGPLELAALAWSLFLTSHTLLDGRWWLWLLPALVPPPLLTVVPALLVVAGLASGIRAHGMVVPLAVSALLATIPQCGLNTHALRRRVPSGQGVEVVIWNTEHWNQHQHDTSAMYEFVQGLGADVYLLQEYCNLVGDGVCPIDDEARLDAAFPGYHRVIKGQLVTLSRFPVVAVPDLAASDLLRVDLQVAPGTVLSTYSVHVPVPLLLVNPFSARFYDEIRTRRADRKRHFEVLLHDLHRNANPVLVSGDLNASPVMLDSARLASALTDAIPANRNLFPVSWHARTPWLRLWRLDWTFVSRQVRPLRYTFLDPGPTSDHRAQRLTLAVAG
jgi:endonuclease/exonuclease/phosphatase (EEP) superfamily protein YafD